MIIHATVQRLNREGGVIPVCEYLSAHSDLFAPKGIYWSRVRHQAAVFEYHDAERIAGEVGGFAVVSSP